MSGGAPEHQGITANVARLLGSALEAKQCRVFSPDLRVRVRATGLSSYADVTVICGGIELDPEVLSPSTEDYDRGEKLGNVRREPNGSLVPPCLRRRRSAGFRNLSQFAVAG
jgi:Uma2 family endonuclease